MPLFPDSAPPREFRDFACIVSTSVIQSLTVINLMGFTKLFNDIVCSSIWNEDDKTRIVWVTLLALKNGNHVAHTSIGGLAVQARVTVEDCKKAIEKLLSPDDDDRSGVLEGRRIQKVPGGFYIVNGEAYRERRDADDRRAYMAELMRNKRRKEKEAKEAAALADVSNRKQPLSLVSTVSLSEEEEEQSKKREEKSALPSVSVDCSNGFDELQKQYPRLNVAKEFSRARAKAGKEPGRRYFERWLENEQKSLIHGVPPKESGGHMMDDL